MNIDKSIVAATARKLRKPFGQKLCQKLINPSPGYLFVVLATICGVLLIAIMPPYMVPDESAHLYRAYQVSEGGFISQNLGGVTGGLIPTQLRDSVEHFQSEPNQRTTYSQHFRTKINTNERSFVRFDSSAVYSVFSYIPQAAGILIARLFYPSDLVILYLGRLFNLLAFIVMVYIAIRTIPLGKWVVVVTALLPMSLQQAASLSSDVTTIGVTFLAVAFCLSLYFQSSTLTKRQHLLIFLLGLILGLTKQTNVLFVIPFLLLPRRLFTSAAMRLLFVVSLAAVSFGAVAAWYILTKLLHYNMAYASAAGVNISEQLGYILHSPWAYVKVLLRTFVFNPTNIPPNPDFYWQSVIGVFSWIKYQLPLPNVIAAYLSITAAFLYHPFSTKRINYSVGSRTKLVYLITFAGSFTAIATALYLVWSPVGSPVIGGIQGRYFLPLIPLLIPIFYNQEVRLVLAKKSYMAWGIAAVVIVNFATMALLTLRYFGA